MSTPVTYFLSQFTSSGGEIFIDSLDSDVAQTVSLGGDYLYSIFSEDIDPSLSKVIFYFDVALSGSQTTDLDAVVANYDGQPGYTGQPGEYLVADLPTKACNNGDSLWAIDGRKSGEGPGNGTGVPVYWDNSNWLVFSTDAPVSD